MPVPQRVLLFTTDLEVGGTPHVVRDLAIRLRGPDRVTAVACICPWGPVAGEIAAAGIRVRAMGAPNSLHLPRVIVELAKLGRSFDVIFSFLMHANFVAAISKPLLPGVRLIQSIQTSQIHPKWHWPLQGLVAPAAETIVVPSHSVAATAQERCSIPREKIRVINNAIDAAPAMAGVLPRPPQHQSSGSAHFRVGFLGRLDEIKRVTDLVYAIALVPGARLDIYGDGDQRLVIEALIHELRLSDRVNLHGTTRTPFQAMQAFDALVLCSDAEGLSLVLIEAMSAGVPIVGTDVPGIRDVVTHEQTGLLVPPRSPTLLAGAIRRMMNDVPLREDLADAALQHVRARFGWEPVLEQYRAVLDG